MGERHRYLRRQLDRNGLSGERLPSEEASWRSFLDTVSRSYQEHDKTRYRLERAVEISSAEMQSLNDELLRRNEDLAQKTVSLESEIDQRHKVEQRLRHEATHDALTQLPNRTMMLNRIDRCIQQMERDGGGMFAVLFVDLDKFKIINDSLGHETGDQLLTAVARRLQRCLRDLDVVSRPGNGFTARMGGDEFVVLLENIPDANVALRVAERLRSVISEPMQIGSHRVGVGASVGITIYTDAGRSAADLLREADTAMYFAKNAGNERCALFDRNMHEAAVARLNLESQLRDAIAAAEFTLHYQPIVETATGRVEAVEALIRWRRPDGSLISPMAFISVAEEMGVITELGRWVLGEACQQAQAWNATLPPDRQIAVCVNISRRQILDGDLTHDIRVALERSGLDPSRLKIEITESIVMTDAERSAEVLEQIRAMGVTVLMDDFGTGYSSLSCLHHFAVDGLKIDRSFVELLEEDNQYSAVVSMIIRLAHTLHKSIICEGIETAAQLSIVRSLGCDSVQGYLLSRPLPADRMTEMLAKPPGRQGLAA